MYMWLKDLPLYKMKINTYLKKFLKKTSKKYNIIYDRLGKIK